MTVVLRVFDVHDACAALRCTRRMRAPRAVVWEVGVTERQLHGRVVHLEADVHEVALRRGGYSR